MGKRENFAAVIRTRRQWVARTLGLPAALALLFLQGFVAAGADANPRRSCLSNVHGSQSTDGLNQDLRESLRAWERGNQVKAFRCAERVLRSQSLREHRTAAYGVLCGLHREIGETEVALRHCNRAIARDGGRNWLHLANRGHTYLLMGRSQEAIVDFDAAIILLGPRADGPWRDASSAREALERLRAHRPSARQMDRAGENVALRSGTALPGGRHARQSPW